MSEETQCPLRCLKCEVLTPSRVQTLAWSAKARIFITHLSSVKASSTPFVFTLLTSFTNSIHSISEHSGPPMQCHVTSLDSSRCTTRSQRQGPGQVSDSALLDVDEKTSATVDKCQHPPNLTCYQHKLGTNCGTAVRSLSCLHTGRTRPKKSYGLETVRDVLRRDLSLQTLLCT